MQYRRLTHNEMLKRKGMLSDSARNQDSKRPRSDLNDSPNFISFTSTTPQGVSTKYMLLDPEVHAEAPSIDHANSDMNADPIDNDTGKTSKLSEHLQAFCDLESHFQDRLFAHKYHRLIGTPCACGNGERTICCGDCYGHNATCAECFISSHRAMPTHWAKVWLKDAGFFVKRDISLLREGGYAIPLGHGGEPCPHSSYQHPTKDSGESHVTFHLIDCNGIHNTKLQFCTCHGSPNRTDQLLDFGFFPATTKRPTMGFSFNVLHQFHIHHLESKSSAYDFIGALRRLTDNVSTRDTSDPYQQFLVVMRFWRILVATERLGQANGIDILTPHRPPGNLLVFCPSCPEPGINMEDRWEETPEHLRHLNHTLFTIDGNFHANRYKKNSSPDDYSLFAGRAYYPTDSEFKAYLRSLPAKDIEDKIDCPIKAVKSQNKSADNLAETGVINVQCPDVIVRSTVDLQRGERYANSDFAIKYAIEQNKDLRSGKPFINPAGYMTSYDMSCAYSVHMYRRFLERFPHIAPAIEKFTFLIPLVHVNNHKENCVYEYACSYIANAGHFHGETAEHEWAEVNQVASQTRQMNNGHRQDVLIDHHSDWNWKKVVNMAATLSNEIVHDRKVFAQKRDQFLSLATIFADRVPTWNLADRSLRKMNSDREIECVYRHRRTKVPTQAKLFQALLDESAKSINKADPSTHRDLAATVLNEALYIEHDQRELTVITSHSDTPVKDIAKLRKRLRDRIDAWRMLQEDLMGETIVALRSSGHDVSGVDEPENECLYFPSDLSPAQLERYQLRSLASDEITLRQGRIYDAIRSIQMARKTCDALNRDKNKNARSQVQKTRATTRMEIPDRLIAIGIANYNASRAALVKLGGSPFMEILPVMTLQDTYRKSTHTRREVGDSRLNNGRIYNLGVTGGAQTKSISSLQYSGAEIASGSAAQVSTQGSKAKPRNDKKATKDRKGQNRKLGSGTEETPAPVQLDSDAPSKETSTSGWIWDLGRLTDMSSDEIQEWSDESDRVQYFRAEAEMHRWQEEYERKQAQFMRCVRSFGTMSKIWNQLSEMNTDCPGRVAHAKKSAAIYAKLEHDAKQRFSAAGYKHRVDAMESDNPPLLADLVQNDRDALSVESVVVDSLLCYPSSGLSRV